MEGKTLEESVQNLRKPPTAPKAFLEKHPVPSTVSVRVRSVRSRSASTGRDKKSELQARYWALLFGNLQRAVNEIYQMVECYENLSSCQETILVLENYIRDFKALAEWFRVSWDYESTPQPHRPHSLAWEVRKSNPVPSKGRARNLSSPVVSGKSSPNYSGKNSPCSTLSDDRRPIPKSINRDPAIKKIDPPEVIIVNRSVEESKIVESPPVKEDSMAIFEETDNRISMNLDWNELMEQEEAEKARQEGEQMKVSKADQFVQTNLDDDHLTLAMYLEKYNITGFFKGNFELVEEKLVKMDSKSVPVVEEEKKEDVQVKEDSLKQVPLVRELQKRPPSYSIVVSREENKSKPLPARNVVTARKPLMNNLAKSSSAPFTSNTTRGTSVQKSLTTSRVQRTGRLPISSKTSENRQTFSGVPTNTAKRISARSNTMIDLKNSRPNSSRGLGSRQNSKYSQEDVASSSSTLKASSEHVGNASLKRKSSRSDLSYRKSEPKSLPTETNDGWLTVKSRSRRSSLHWSNRFNQPSGYASLPILSLLDETTETKDEPQAETISEKPRPKPNTTEKKRISTKPKVTSGVGKCVSTKVTKINGLVRQKSDVPDSRARTSLKTKRAEDKLIEVKTPEPDLFIDLEDEIPKVDMNIQTLLASDLRNTINLSSCDEMDDKDLEESDDDQKKLLEEQENLERQIRELENTEIDVDTETDETDCEVLIDTEDLNEDGERNHEEIDFFDENMTLEMKYQSLLSDMSSGERLETLATLQAFVARHPGRAQELHQKLSSPSRRRSLHETLKKYQAKQTRAQEKREALQREKTLKIQHLLARVEDVKAAKQQLIEEKRMRMEERLQRAAENRTQFLKDKVKKAHDEEEKLKEIAFIKSLEAQNKRLDILESCKEHEGRLQDLEQERQKRVEEKAAKEAAAERRRLELEQERQRRLEQMWETKREREKRVGKLQEQREKMRQEMAREKARDREERLQALQAQKIATTEELQRKIIQKQQESARRHEENIEHIRQRAQELGIPNRNTDEQNAEGSCDGDLSSTVSDVSVEPNKAFRKKLKRLRQKLSDKTTEYMNDMTPLASHFRRDSEVPKIINVINKGGGPQGMERPLGK
ncbi:hypothetical protein DMENIID0001_090690 [Sergentomyia squamirostris]